MALAPAVKAAQVYSPRIQTPLYRPFPSLDSTRIRREHCRPRGRAAGSGRTLQGGPTR